MDTQCCLGDDLVCTEICSLIYTSSMDFGASGQFDGGHFYVGHPLVGILIQSSKVTW